MVGDNSEQIQVESKITTHKHEVVKIIRALVMVEKDKIH